MRNLNLATVHFTLIIVSMLIYFLMLNARITDTRDRVIDIESQCTQEAKR